MLNLGQQMRLGEMLLQDGVVDQDALDSALAEQHRSGGRIGEVLVRMGALPEGDLMRALSRQLHIPFLDLASIEIPREVSSTMTARMVSHYGVVPVRLTDDTLTIAIHDALDVQTLDELRMHLKRPVEPVFATMKDIRATTKKYYGIGADTMEGLMEDQAAEKGGGDVVNLDIGGGVDDIQDSAADASIIRFVNQLIMEAIDDRATDIHVEPLEDELQIRYRIDGLLYDAQVPAEIRRFQSAIISRLKIMADMNIAERRLPQDGKIVIRKAEQDYDLRVSTIPTPYGESIVLRILSRNSDFVTLDKLGFTGRNVKLLRHMISRPHGIILVTGPTGSGKSTTLYAALNEINRIDQKIITIEDPIEYRIRGVAQIQVNPRIGLTFAACLRTILRQDPDVIMVGETRDTETAQITIRTALTGHLVFSTLHTNDACSAVTRLLDMDIEPFLISSSVEGLLAQRLVRVLCPSCKQRYNPEPDVLRKINDTGESASELELYRKRGCEKCRYTGFTGRTAIYELVRITEEFRRLIVERAPANMLKKAAMEDGMRTLRSFGWEKVKQGATSIDEIMRVTLEDEIELEKELDVPPMVPGAKLEGGPASGESTDGTGSASAGERGGGHAGEAGETTAAMPAGASTAAPVFRTERS